MVDKVVAALIFVGITLLVLKLTSVITWSWWLVTLPIWIGPLLAVVFLLLFSLPFIFGDNK